MKSLQCYKYDLSSSFAPSFDFSSPSWCWTSLLGCIFFHWALQFHKNYTESHILPFLICDCVCILVRNLWIMLPCRVTYPVHSFLQMLGFDCCWFLHVDGREKLAVKYGRLLNLKGLSLCTINILFSSFWFVSIQSIVSLLISFVLSSSNFKSEFSSVWILLNIS